MAYSRYRGAARDSDDDDDNKDSVFGSYSSNSSSRRASGYTGESRQRERRRNDRGKGFDEGYSQYGRTGDAAQVKTVVGTTERAVVDVVKATGQLAATAVKGVADVTSGLFAGAFHLSDIEKFECLVQFYQKKCRRKIFDLTPWKGGMTFEQIEERDASMPEHHDNPYLTKLNESLQHDSPLAHSNYHHASVIGSFSDLKGSVDFVDCPFHFGVETAGVLHQAVADLISHTYKACPLKFLHIALSRTDPDSSNGRGFLNGIHNIFTTNKPEADDIIAVVAPDIPVYELDVKKKLAENEREQIVAQPPLQHIFHGLVFNNDTIHVPLRGFRFTHQHAAFQIMTRWSHRFHAFSGVNWEKCAEAIEEHWEMLEHNDGEGFRRVYPEIYEGLTKALAPTANTTPSDAADAPFFQPILNSLKLPATALTESNMDAVRELLNSLSSTIVETIAMPALLANRVLTIDHGALDRHILQKGTGTRTTREIQVPIYDFFRAAQAHAKHIRKNARLIDPNVDHFIRVQRADGKPISPCDAGFMMKLTMRTEPRTLADSVTTIREAVKRAALVHEKHLVLGVPVNP